MRFPFTFMGFLSVALALWTAAYLVLRRPADPIELALAAATVALSLSFGLYVLVRRLRRQA